MSSRLNKILFRLELALRLRPKKEEVTIFATDALRLVQLLKEEGAKSRVAIVEEIQGKLVRKNGATYRES